MSPEFHNWVIALAILLSVANGWLVLRLSKDGLVFPNNTVPTATAFPLIVCAAAVYWHDSRTALIALTLASVGSILIGLQRVTGPRR